MQLAIVGRITHSGIRVDGPTALMAGVKAGLWCHNRESMTLILVKLFRCACVPRAAMNRQRKRRW